MEILNNTVIIPVMIDTDMVIMPNRTERIIAEFTSQEPLEEPSYEVKG